jgi:hypothetical protein
MRFDFIEKPINLKELPKDCSVDTILVENNEKQIEKICEFLLDDKKLLTFNGFKGSGKSKVVDFAVKYGCNEDILILKYMCLETTILDDMLLSFFEDFRNYTMKGVLNPLKIKVENFTQKINAYFNTIEKPILIVLDSFDSIIKANKPDIINFIKHLTSFENIKIIVISKAMLADEFEGCETEQVTALPLNKKLFEKYLRANDIKQIGVLSNELYKQTKGYYGYLKLSVNIMKLRQISLVNFLEMFSKSYTPFPEFVIREAIALIDPVSAHLFRLLTVMRIPIHINLIKSLHLYDENRVLFFINNSILANDGESLYLKDSFRYIMENQIPENVMIKLHSACVDLYNTQLPLKPLERDLKLSRQTMRNEIEYHSMFIPKKPVINPKMLTQLQPTMVVSAEAPKPQEVQIQEENKNAETKEEKIEKISFIIEDEAVLDNIADSIKDFVVTTVKDNQLEQESNSMRLGDILNFAKQKEVQYDYKSAIMLYQSALTKTNDDNFYTYLPLVYVNLAKSYQKLSKLYEALEYYTQAQDFYVNASNLLKANEMKLEIANIYYSMYKHDNAKFILSELEQTSDLPNELAIKVNLACAKLTDDVAVEHDYYKKSLPLVEIGTSKDITTELYYKYAVSCDELEDLNTAVKYYKKCINIEQNPRDNQYLTLAISNLAQLYDEVGQTKIAIKYYAESIKIDSSMKNYSGLYQNSVHLAEIFVATDENKALEYLTKALEYAKNLPDGYYEVSANLELGDFYLLRQDNEKAYKHFINAYDIAKISFSKDNLDRISSRIDDIKKRVPEQLFNEYQGKYGK